MRICFYGNQLGSLFGNYRHILNLAKRFQEEGHEVSVVTKGREQWTRTVEGVRYESISLEKKKTFRSFYLEFPIKSLLYFLRHRQFDIIHSTAGYNLFAVLARLVGAVSGSPIIYEIVSPPSSSLRLLRFAKLICASMNIRQRFGQEAVFIPHCVDLESFNITSRYDYGSDASFVVGTMGSAVPRRGFEYLIRAVPLVLQKHPGVRFVLAIEHPQTKYLPEMMRHLARLRELVQASGVSSSIEMVAGEVDVATFFNSLDAFVYAIQTTEGMVDIPPTILECLAGGCALISTRVGGIPEVVRSYENGILVEEDDCNNPQAYADKIIGLIENRELFSRIRGNARDSVKDYDIDVIAPRIMGVYEEVLSRRA
jgi:glycosyltransferase involved in cell wall biosynthesis